MIKHSSSDKVRRAFRTTRVIRKRLASIRPSPENLALYRPIDPDDPELQALADSIRQHGLHELLVVTKDGYIVSGHRRYAALMAIGQVVAPCKVLPIRRADMSRDEFVALLRDHNRQRYKNVAEQMRETLVDIDPLDAYRTLQQHREEALYHGEKVETLTIEGTKRRHRISDQKAEHVKYINQVVFSDRRDYWPLSVRGIHYPLLNYDFYRNIPRKIKYKNDDNSYEKTSELLTRMRLNGDIPWHAIDDGTRPLTMPRPFSNVRHFIRREVDNILEGYWRNLLQSQPAHIEVLCEKNTIYHMVLRVTSKYQIPTISGRGFCSIDPWHDLYERFIDSGKSRLVVITLTDFDPEGQMIPHVGGRTLRDDFGLPADQLEIVPAAVTRTQIDDNNLPPQNFAKESSSNYDWFVNRNDGDTNVYELEALDPAVMLADLERTIESVIDVDLFNKEIAIEKEEAAHLQAARVTAIDALRGLIDEHR